MLRPHCSHRRPPSRHAFALAAALLLLLPRGAFAADTTEPFDLGALDVDFYVGVDGLGDSERGIFSDLFLGYGLTTWLSLHAGITLSSRADLGDATTDLYGGVFATMLDTRHVDLDLSFELRGGGVDFGDLSLSPGFEVNFDADPTMKTWGLYLRGLLPLCSRQTFSVDHPSRGHLFDDIHAELTLGAYLTVAEGQQLLLEHDIELQFTANDDEDLLGVGGLALGYNIVITKTLELITQLYLDIPQAGEDVSFGLTLGFILTAPPPPS